jgi:hypothetical protein
MYIHKYSINDHTVYIVSEKSAKPSKNFVLTSQDWKGYSSGSGVGNALKFLGGLTFSKEEKEIKEEKKEEPKTKKKAVSDLIRKLALDKYDAISFVLVAHVKPTDLTHVTETAGKIHDLGKDLNEDNLKNCLEYNKLQLRSTSPDALKNLLNNLKKVK